MAPLPPLVSCILVTRNRRPFFAQAMQYYQAQTYPNSELIVVDDGDTTVEDLCQGQPHVTYVRLSERTPTGSKLNLGIQAARGDILQKIDDDDYYGPEFLSKGAARLLGAEVANPLVAWCCFGIFIAGETELYFSGHGWHAGGTFCFRRELWQQRPFRDVYKSSDSWFIHDHRPAIRRVCAADQYMICRHGKNTWVRIKGYDSVEEAFRRRRYPGTLEEVVGPRHAAFYRSLNRPAEAAHA